MKTLEQVPQLEGKIPLDVVEKLTRSMAALESALLAEDPEMKNHLRNSHALLITYPESVHLLDDEGIKTVIDAAQKLMTVQIVSEVAKSKRAPKTKPSVDDL